MNDSTSAEVEQGSPSQSLFFQLLHNMISNESHTGVIDWTPDGEAFAVLLKTEFEDNILPLYFPHARYTSFLRRLKRWGFKRLYSGAYRHDRFKRDMVFDTELDEVDPSNPFNSSKALPPKKRTMAMTLAMTQSAPPFEEQHLSRSDVTFMPELMRNINLQKRMEKVGAVPPPSKKAKKAGTPEQSVAAAQTLASLGGHHASHQEFYDRSAYSAVARGVMSPQHMQHQMNPQQMMQQVSYQNTLYAAALQSRQTYAALYGIGKPAFLCQTTSDSGRVPIRDDVEKKNPAFNRAA